MESKQASEISVNSLTLSKGKEEIFILLLSYIYVNDLFSGEKIVEFYR